MFTPFTVQGCSLELMQPGEQGIIPDFKITHEQELIEIGLTPGTFIKVKAKNPIFQIEVNNTIISIDKEIARKIYVRLNM
ncbi:FeoA family protein [Calothrix brevissima NIES-22]|nr:FeoA family protein [Calothrix brevissima NIES-22]